MARWRHYTKNGEKGRFGKEVLSNCYRSKVRTGGQRLRLTDQPGRFDKSKGEGRSVDLCKQKKNDRRPRRSKGALNQRGEQRWKRIPL